ncbi:HEPN domain-containing protein [Nonomuraea sp. NPDC049152]|uniref:HEPN domain-containing protein n=1 Tax=Nonomuraea sp. NPDC049152 TaxID=3154350 RepID=UPI0034040B9C
MPSPVSLLFEEQAAILSLLQANEPSFHATLESTFPKVLLLAAASNFETRICQHVLDFVSANSSNGKVVALVDSRVVKRSYHTWFEWDKLNANGFWAFFGEDFRTRMKQLLKSDATLSESIKAFLELGRLRNHLVHKNYALFTLEKTSEEIHHLYLQADLFVNSLPKLLDETY